jgi:hypothetical protein
MFPETPVIQKSTNYDIFKKIEWNRSVDKGNFQKLLAENRDNFQLHRFPILVTKDYKIIDGQHRFEVAKEIGSPIYYIKEDSLDDSFENVHSVNKAGKRHTIKDKLEMLHKAGNENVSLIYKTFYLYDGAFDLGTVANVLTMGTEGGSTKKQIDNSGTVLLKNYDKGLEVLDALHFSSVPGKHKNRTVFAVASLSKVNDVHPKAIVKRVVDNLIRWVEPRSKLDAERSIATCYNYNLTAQNRLKMSKPL